MAEAQKSSKPTAQPKITHLPCGCVYQEKDWILLRINECEYHHRRRTSKRPYRPKAECVRP